MTVLIVDRSYRKIAGGPYLTRHQTSKMLGINIPSVDKRIGRGTLLAAVAVDGTILLPAVQFKNGKAIKPLTRVGRIFTGYRMDSWSIAGWLATPNPHLEGLTPREWVLQGKSQYTLTEVAHARGALANLEGYEPAWPTRERSTSPATPCGRPQRTTNDINLDH